MCCNRPHTNLFLLMVVAMAQAQTWTAVRRSAVSGKTLYDELGTIPIYRNHRESLRPWDRKLPAIVEQEANRRSMWILKPPSGLYIAFVLLCCMIATIGIAIVPFLVNMTFIQDMWRDIPIPSIVYYDARVLFAVSIVIHICTAFALWFIYLSEGFSKHQLELAPLCLSMLLECVWMDVAFYIGRLDWTLALWCAIFALTFLAQIFLIKKDVVIGMVFLLPQLIGALVVMLYTIEFIKLNGTSIQRAV